MQKNAIVTGASSGIGRALAQLLVQDGYTVYITGRRENLLQEIQAENPAQYRIKAFDVTDQDATERAFQEMTADLGALDLMVVNAGWGTVNKKLDWQIEQQVIQTNVVGAAHMCVQAMQVFYKQGYGQLAGISSIASLLGGRLNPAYNGSKAFLSNYLHGLRQTVKARRLSNVYITDIRPGFIRTDLVQGDKIMWIQPLDKAVRQIYSAIKRRKKVAYVTKRWGLVAWVLKHFNGWA